MSFMAVVPRVGDAGGFEGDPAVGPGVHLCAGPEDLGGEVGAGLDARAGGRAGLVGEALAEGLHGRVFGERRVLCEVVGPAHEREVEADDIAAAIGVGVVAGPVADVVLPAGVWAVGGGDAVEGEEAVGPGGRGFAGVDLFGEVAVNDEVGPDSGADGAVGGRDSGDAVDEPVRLAEVEARVGGEGHEVDAGLDVAGTDGDGELAAVGVGADGAGHAGNVDRADEMIALDPGLELAGAVAGVGADFEVDDDDDPGVEGRGLGGNRCREEKGEEEAHEIFQHGTVRG